MLRTTLLLGLLMVGCRQAPLVPTPPVHSTPGWESQLDALLLQYREEEHIPGLAMAVVKDDQVLYLKAFGMRDVERQLPATVDTLFGIGSCTKACRAPHPGTGCGSGGGCSHRPGAADPDDPGRGR